MQPTSRPAKPSHPGVHTHAHTGMHTPLHTHAHTRCGACWHSLLSHPSLSKSPSLFTVHQAPPNIHAFAFNGRALRFQRMLKDFNALMFSSQTNKDGRTRVSKGGTQEVVETASLSSPAGCQYHFHPLRAIPHGGRWLDEKAAHQTSPLIRPPVPNASWQDSGNHRSPLSQSPPTLVLHQLSLKSRAHVARDPPDLRPTLVLCKMGLICLLDLPLWKLSGEQNKSIDDAKAIYLQCSLLG